MVSCGYFISIVMKLVVRNNVLNVGAMDKIRSIHVRIPHRWVYPTYAPYRVEHACYLIEGCTLPMPLVLCDAIVF